MHSSWLMPALLLVLGVIGVSEQRNGPIVNTYTDADALAIYHTIMPSATQGKRLLVLSTTRKPMCEGLEARASRSGDYAEAVADLSRLNLQTWGLEGMLRTNTDSEFVTQGELNSLFHGNVIQGWKEFYRKHPNAAGYISFSAVGFSLNRKLAAVYSASICGAHCGHGTVLFLKRGASGWEKVTPPFSTCDWIS